MDCVGPVVEVIDTYLVAPLLQQIYYLRSSGANVHGLQTVVRKLMARRNDERSSLKATENAGQVMTDVASNWFDDVEAIKTEADTIEKEYNQGTCSGGWCGKCWSRYKLSKSSVQLKQKAERRLNEQFVLTRRPSLEPVIEIEIEPLIKNQPSTQSMLQQMLDCIDDPCFGIIGVYGMGGVGKTTLAGKVNNHFKDNSCFEIVIMVTVSATPNIRSIQMSIGKRLGLDLSNDSNDDDAREKLLNALRKKKFLLILDDVWRKLELNDVGIPHPQNHRGSKILVTSRSQDACTDMDARKTIKVEPLSIDESWSLFLDKAGQHVIADRIESLAEKIVQRCKGLPLAIITVARAMANRQGVGEWANAVREIEQSATDLRGMKEEVLVPLKFSFDRLEDDLLRSLFLYCACFSQDFNIGKHEILDFCVGEGLVDRLGSLIDAMNKGEALIGSLKIACMLEDGESEGSVRMHDMMKELALWITSSESDGSSKFLIRTGHSFKEAPRQTSEWVDATRISLMDTKIKELPKLGERCPKLTTLLLRQSKMIIIVPPTNFLQHMDHLSILDLSDTHALEYLPDSLSCLMNLRVLRLRNCIRLRTLPALGMLRQLQVLDLYLCKTLDQQILGSERLGGISNLRYLNVSRSKVFIPMGVISCLLKLEELRLYNADNIRWKVNSENEEEEERGSDLSTIDVGELSHLTHLTSLKISFRDVIISDWFKPIAKMITVLILQRCTIIKQDDIQALNESHNLWFIRVQECSGLTCVPTRIEHRLEIWNCKDLEKVLDGAEAYQDSFQRLESLDLRRLPRLKSICVGVATLKCFGQLWKIEIENCNRLKMVFMKGMPCLFKNLEIIIIRRCHRMEVIIEAEEEEDGKVISPFPKLKTIRLYELPALVDVCNNHVLHCPLIEDVEVNKCLRLEKDPLHICNTNGLLVIEGTKWEGKVVLEEGIQEICP